MKKWWVVPLTLAVAGTGIGWITQNREAPVSVKTDRLMVSSVEQTVTCSGVIESGAGESVLAPTGVVIAKVAVEEGQPIHRGEVIAVVDKTATRAKSGNDAVALRLAAMPESILAPTDGIVLAVNAKERQWLADGEPCVVIAARDRLQVRVAIREKNLRRVKVGQTVHISGEGLSEPRYDGRLTRIDSAAKSGGAGGEAIVEGVVTFDPGVADESMRLGLTAKAAVVTQVIETGIVVPYSAVFEDDDGEECVYVVTDNRAEKRRLPVAADLADGVLLTGTDWKNALIVTEPTRVSDGTLLTVQTTEVR